MDRWMAAAAGVWRLSGCLDIFLQLLFLSFLPYLSLLSYHNTMHSGAGWLVLLFCAGQGTRWGRDACLL